MSNYGHAHAVHAALAKLKPDAEQAKKEVIAILIKQNGK